MSPPPIRQGTLYLCVAFPYVLCTVFRVPSLPAQGPFVGFFSYSHTSTSYVYRVYEGLQRQRSLSLDDIGSWEGAVNDSPSSSAGVPPHQPFTQFTPPDVP
ncbi:MAG: hypothetical protein ACI8RD_009957 [Bacillariaceae sp.]|jgi:hypothetical protein